ncbi:MAG: hypothetical protein IID40_04770 [Planctomycetes bacterium]|nr:hypothetical protein [Planctomycetota bacterium]
MNEASAPYRSEVPGAAPPDRRRWPVLLAAWGWTLALSHPLLGQPVNVVDDPLGDAVARRTDPGGDGPFDPLAHRLIDLTQWSLGQWSPTAPMADLFSGSYSPSGDFLRLDLTIDGLVNPPGGTRPDSFAPFLYGDHPVFGFVEIDLDNNNYTGGEVDGPHYRYLGNVVRFGGRPTGAPFSNRVAADGSAFDGDFVSPPFVERHGEEFHLALLGDQFLLSDVVEALGNGNPIFEAGEIWDITAPWFHRAHGFEPFAFGGAYTPECTLRFHHDPASDTTRLSLVFPLTNVGAGLMTGQPPEPNNFDDSDQASILEALEDLAFSAGFYTPPFDIPETDLIWGWFFQTPSQYLQPMAWRLTALLGTSYTVPDPTGEYFVWTDVSPDVALGDIDGNGVADAADVFAIQSYIAALDGQDGTIDGTVPIADFARDFSVYDVSYDGQIDMFDAVLAGAGGDTDGDGDVDLMDFGVVQACYADGPGSGFLGVCADLDLDGDGDIDLQDFGWFVAAMGGPNTDGNSTSTTTQNW